MNSDELHLSEAWLQIPPLIIYTIIFDKQTVSRVYSIYYYIPQPGQSNAAPSLPVTIFFFGDDNSTVQLFFIWFTAYPWGKKITKNMN